MPLERPGQWTKASIYRLFPRLAERKLSRGRQLSGGEQEMLSIARALLINPKLLILDEPSQGLAPLITREVFRIVAQMRAEGISVLLVEQNVRMSLADRRPRLCARRRSRRLFRAGAGACRGRSARPVADRRERRGMDAALARFVATAWIRWRRWDRGRTCCTSCARSRCPCRRRSGRPRRRKSCRPR